jgi:hypothetical protein
MSNVKCERCDTWSDEIPLVKAEEDEVRGLTFLTCGKCYHTSVWHLGAPVPILISYEEFYGEEPEWKLFKK